MVRLELNFDINDELVNLFKESTSDPFIGEVGGAKTHDWCLTELERIQTTQLYGGKPRLGFLKIIYDDQLVGFSLPCVIKSSEYPIFKIDPDDQNTWHRLGTIYVSNSFRRKGIVTKAISTFLQEYKYCIWVCDIRNEASKRSAFAGGFDFSHKLWHRVKGESSLTKLDECERISLVFKREEYIR